MHPFLQDNTARTGYLTAWGLVGLILTGLLAGTGALTWPAALVLALPSCLVYGFMCLSARYLSAAYPLERTPAPVFLGVHLLAAALAASLWLLFIAGWSLLLDLAGVPGFAAAPGPPELRLLFGFGVTLFWLAAAAHYLLRAVETRRAVERRALELDLHAREAELTALRNQVHPHFLFNSLNSVHALIASDPEEARRMLLRLAAFLRQTLSLGNDRFIPLGEELALACGYLEIERMRFGDRLSVEVDVPESLHTVPVPPFCLLPLAENAVRHGISQLLEGGTVRIAGGTDRGVLHLTVENPVEAGGAPARGAGTGLANLRTRLRSLVGVEGGVDTVQERGLFRARIRLRREEVS